MPRRTLRAAARRGVAVAVTLGTAVAGLLATAPAADAAAAADVAGTATDAQALSADGIARAAYLGPVAPAPAVRVDGHIGGMATALGLRAGGFDFESTVDPVDVARAAERFGVAIEDPLRARDVGRVRDAAWRHAGYRMMLRGIAIAGAPDIADLQASADATGYDYGTRVDVGDIDGILAAAHEVIAAQLRAGGFSFGDWVDESDLVAAARLYGVKLGKTLDSDDAPRVAAVVAEKGDAERSPRYARVGKVDLHLPGFGPHYVGFHQSSSPSGKKQKATGDVHTDVLPSRKRGTGRSTAVDVVLAPGDEVVAAVTGTVVEATSYSLYGKYRDVRIRIVPDQDRSMVVTMLHMTGRKVAVGDRVAAGKTVVASGARAFPFASQIDRFAGRSWGHVHVEARQR